MKPQSLLRTPSRQADGLLVSASPNDVGWSYVHFQAHRVGPGATLTGETVNRETALIVLSGRCDVEGGGERFADLGNRTSVWEKHPPFTLLLPPGLSFRVATEDGVHLSIARAPAEAAGS